MKDIAQMMRETNALEKGKKVFVCLQSYDLGIWVYRRFELHSRSWETTDIIDTSTGEILCSTAFEFYNTTTEAHQECRRKNVKLIDKELEKCLKAVAKAEEIDAIIASNART